MKKEECTIGAQVYTEDGFYYLYEVTALPNEDGVVSVKRIYKSSYAPKEDSFHLDEIHLYDESHIKEIGKEMQAHIDAAASAFEDAFQAFQKVREFQTKDGVHVSDYELKEMGLVSFKKLEDAIEQHGWSMSSLRC